MEDTYYSTQVVCELDTLIAKSYGSKVIITDRDDIIAEFETETGDPFEIRCAVLHAFYKKIEVKNQNLLKEFS